MEEEQLSYLRPRMEDGVLQQAVVVSQGDLVGVEEDTPAVTPLGPDPRSEEDLANTVQTDVVADVEAEVDRSEQVVR